MKFSVARCLSGEHAVGGGFHAVEVDYASATVILSVPEPLAEGAIPTQWLARVDDAGAGSQVRAYAVCVPN